MRKNADDLPYFAADGDESFISLLTDVTEKSQKEGVLFDMFNVQTVTVPLGTGDERRLTGHTLFANNMSLFEVTNVGALQSIRDMESDFGILPMPKYDEKQENYISRTIDGWLYCVPMSNTELEMTSVIMEEMAIGAKNYIVPAYYNVALRDKYTRDADSVEMLDIVYNTRAFDMGDVFWLFDIRNVFVNIMRTGGTGFASVIESNLTKINDTIEKAIDNFS